MKIAYEIKHYVILTILLFVSFFIGDNYFNLSDLDRIEMFIFWLIALFISDKITHKIID